MRPTHIHAHTEGNLIHYTKTKQLVHDRMINKLPTNTEQTKSSHLNKPSECYHTN